ncbi:AAA family ATPase [Clostridium sp. A1-XYC3]|uniref:AAA family ATPase n=1 Tax=Clostridium tanneri TaxID=3037988 RepID=A0ABU4JXK4_9CLOT|nr:AAA family ATPase [Clostridium sp. A1-XYC3]MDW8802634.1 AAA family ATPase [Clostridium sp. A1-XYC3]
MYIREVFVRNFRKFNDEGVTFNFRKGINIILGENNGGKSSIIDALRLALLSGQYRKGIYINISDFHINEFGERASEIRIDVYFEELTEEQAVAFYKLTDGANTSKAELHVIYQTYKDNKGNEKVKDYIYGGSRNEPIDKETFDNINLVFMAALRDVENDLKPSRNSQLASLLYTFAPNNEDRERITSTFIEANERVKGDEAISAVEKTINSNLSLIEKEELNQQISINLISPTFESIAGNLDLCYEFPRRYIKILRNELKKLREHFDISDLSHVVSDVDEDYIKVDVKKLKEDGKLVKLYNELISKIQGNNLAVRQNGLGYNNLLSMATTLGDLQKKPSDEEISIFLVEEPESHLHPQLLELLFNFFRQSDKSNKIQIFMTSHSPTLVSKADIDSLNIMYNQDGKVNCSSLSQLQLLDEDKEDLKRYLDVTKSQLFFAKRIVFVEGISEAILLSEFANLMGKPFDKYSVEVVNIDGVDFEPFAKLFADNGDHKNLKHLCAIISDDDRCTNQDDKYVIKNDELTFSKADINAIRDKLKKGQISSRAQKLNGFSGDNVLVKLAMKTLEYELALPKENTETLLKVLDKIHPKNSAKIKGLIEKGEEQEKIAIMIWLAVRDCKGAFAQRLASEINKITICEQGDKKFKVPNYIQSAINFLIQ